MATLKNKSLKKSLNETAEGNARVTKGTSKNQVTIKEGVPSEHSRKHLGGGTTVGASIGTTLNMGDYESLRVDVWITDEIHESESVTQAYARVSDIISTTLHDIVSAYK